MSYDDFTLDKISKIFSVKIEEKTEIFSHKIDLQIDPFFLKYLQNNIPLAQAIGTEKAKSEMIAADKLNQSEGNNLKNIYGCVTNGNQWLFLQLTDNKVLVDLDEYYINQPEKIIGIFVNLIQCELNVLKN